MADTWESPFSCNQLWEWGEENAAGEQEERDSGSYAGQSMGECGLLY